jgi:hypothetical protein
MPTPTTRPRPRRVVIDEAQRDYLLVMADALERQAGTGVVAPMIEPGVIDALRSIAGAYDGSMPSPLDDPWLAEATAADREAVRRQLRDDERRRRGVQLQAVTG